MLHMEQEKNQSLILFKNHSSWQPQGRWSHLSSAISVGDNKVFKVIHVDLPRKKGREDAPFYIK